MIETTEKLHDTLRSSLRFCLYPESTVKRYVSYGLDLCAKLSSSGAFIQLFAAVDIVSSFFSVTVYSSPRLSPLTPSQNNGSFERVYVGEYSRFIASLFDSAFFRMIGNDVRGMSLKGGKDRELLERYVYQGLLFLIVEAAYECPFTTLVGPYPYTSSLVESFDGQSIAPPERRALPEQEERDLLIQLGLWESKGNETEDGRRLMIAPLNSADRALTTDPKFEALFSAVFRECGHEDDGRPGQNGNSATSAVGDDEIDLETDLSRLAHVLDYKLLDSYLCHFKEFEPEERLRHKIALLKYLSRLATDRSPFISEYSGQWTSGAPNPAFLCQGWKVFLLKMLEGAPVFLGKPEPIYDRDKITVRFHILEDLMSSCEKVGTNSARNRFTHLTLHKLCSMLIAHDLVKHLGNISKMDVILEIVLCRETKGEDAVRSTNALNARIMREKIDLNAGFMIKLGAVQSLLLIEQGVTKIGIGSYPCASSPHGEGCASQSKPSSQVAGFFEKIDSYVASAGRIGGRPYDFYFGRSGMFFAKASSTKDADHPDRPAASQADSQAARHTASERDTALVDEDLYPNPELADLNAKGQYRSLPNHQRAFVCETGKIHVLAGGSETEVFKPVAVDDLLDSFLPAVRSFVLNLVTEEAIQFRLAHIERMKR